MNSTKPTCLPCSITCSSDLGIRLGGDPASTPYVQIPHSGAWISLWLLLTVCNALSLQPQLCLPSDTRSEPVSGSPPIWFLASRMCHKLHFARVPCAHPVATTCCHVSSIQECILKTKRNVFFSSKKAKDLKCEPCIYFSITL